MQHKTITLSKWGYQPHFRYCVETWMNDVMKELGVPDAGAECLLVGANIPGRQCPHSVCVEPEDGKWPINLFDGLLDSIETEVADHPLKNMHYGDKPSMQDKPENIRRDSLHKALRKKLEAYDAEQGVVSFVGGPAPIDDYHVAPILQLPSVLFERFRPLRETASDGHVIRIASLIHAAVFEVLSEAHNEMLRPEPGRDFAQQWASPKEIVRRAAVSFMNTLKVAIGSRNYWTPNLFERLNSISSLMYEGAEGKGRLLLATPESGSVDMLLQFVETVPFREARWSRKVLQMASSETALVADCESVVGLGNVAAGADPWKTQDVFEIEFVSHYHWRLSCGDESMLVARYGVPTLPQKKFPLERLFDTYQRLFPEVGKEDVARFVKLYEAAIQQRHGNMLIVARDAEREAYRLCSQGTRIEPTEMTPDLYRQVSRIDGTIVIDPFGVCHAIGVILDGQAQPECSPSRGSRYNSAVRYVYAVETPRLAVVVSDDETVDIIPVLRPRIKRTAIAQAVSELNTATADNYHSAINWLDRHRFYLNQEQCDQINTALERIRREPAEIGEARRIWKEFAPHPDLDDSYFESENTEPASSKHLCLPK